MLTRFAEAKVVAVDIPIGLPPPYPRLADVEAARFVGPRASSVFLTPLRDALASPSYARAVERQRSWTGKGVSQQAYALRHRIFEVEEALEKRVIEAHPEVSFRELAGQPLATKHSEEGRIEREAALAAAGIELPAAPLPRGLVKDALDAAAVAWTAWRHARREAVALPAGTLGRGVIWR